MSELGPPGPVQHHYNGGVACGAAAGEAADGLSQVEGVSHNECAGDFGHGHATGTGEGIDLYWREEMEILLK